MPEYSDDKVLEMLRSPETENRSKALRYLYDVLFGFIAPFVVKNGGNASDAEDLFQDGLIAFYEKVVDKDFELTSSIKNYVYGICRNMWFKRFKKGKKEISVEDVAIFSQVEAEDETGSLERLLELEGHLLALSIGCQRILKLYYFDKKSMNDIASLLDLASGGVAKNKKARCLQKLKALFQAGKK